MKKKLILLFLLFFLTGCSVEYNLDFSDKKFEEKIKIGAFDKNEIGAFDLYEPFAYDDGITSENYNLDYKDNYLYLDYEYSISKFRISNTLTECYDLSGVTSDDDGYYYILTSEKFKCLDYDGYVADEVRINFTTGYKVVETNADSVNDGVYTWIINESNSNSKPINIKLDSKVLEENSNKESNNYKNLFNYLIFVGIFIGIILLIFIFIKLKSKNANSID